MGFDRIKVLEERLRQRFDPAEADELRCELEAAEQEIAAAQEMQRPKPDDPSHTRSAPLAGQTSPKRPSELQGP